MQTTLTIPEQTSPAVSFSRPEILIPTDLSVASNAAVVQAARLASRMQGRLTLFHVAEFPSHDRHQWAFGGRTGARAERERSPHEQLDALAREARVPSRVVVEHAASPAAALIDRIVATAPDLVVMTTHGRRGLAHLLAGSVAEQVVGETKAPLLCVRTPVPLDRVLGGCTILGTDFGENAVAALDLAGGLVRAFGGDLLVVYQPSRDPVYPWQPYKDAERCLAHIAEQVPVRLVVDTAPLRLAVGRALKAERAGLLVVPRHREGSRGLDAVTAVRDAPCSVLVV